MPAVANSLEGRHRRHGVRGADAPKPSHPVRRRRGAAADVSAAVVSPSVDLIAPGLAFQVPTLAGVETEYVYNGSTPTICRLARTALRAEVATVADWQESRQQPIAFLSAAMRRFAREAVNGVSAYKTFWMDSGIVDAWDEYASYRKQEIDPGRAYLVMDTSVVTPIVVGRLYDRMFAVHPQLPATFFRKFVSRGIAQFFRVFSHWDLEWEIENRESMLDENDPQEVKTVQAYKDDLPAYMKRRPLGGRAFQRLVDGLPRRSKMRQALVLADELERLIAPIPRIRLDRQDEGMLDDCGAARPFLSLHFYDWDALHGLLEDEMNHCMEVSAWPNCFIPMQVSDVESVRAAFTQFAARLKALALTTRITELIPYHAEYTS